MRNKDGEVDYESIILVDFDQAGYGFRMWDIQYFLRSVSEYLSNKQQTFQQYEHPANAKNNQTSSHK